MRWLIAMAVVLGLFLAWSVHDLDRPVKNAHYVTSGRCAACHPAAYATWHQTFHRTMTQLPTKPLGDFSGRSLQHGGITSRFFRDGDRYVIETLDVDNRLKAFPVAMTVGSRRVQQYVARVGDRHARLPLAWNVEEKRWFHLSGGFLHPDGADFNQHRATWDSNCIFCHNVKARPGFDFTTQRFNASVAELGVACEACHGPGSEHVRRNANPLRRYLLRALDRDDPTIVQPGKLPKKQRLQVCGHCHGQRLPNPRERIREFATDGDPYTPGDDLDRYTTPIWRDTKLEGVDLALRFWNDGTPRLTAYEYQGLLQSADYQRGDLTCGHCHAMHGSDPRGMLRRGDPCQQCHRDLPRDHSKHKTVTCYDCHMPRITYGLLDVHPTHRITRPDPSRAWRYDMPEACTLCHVDKPAAWAAKQPTAPRASIAENVHALLAGDVVQRSVAVMAFSRAKRLWSVPLLLVTMDDDYPAVRHFAVRALRRVVAGTPLAPSFAQLPPFDANGDHELRRGALAAYREWWQRADKRGIENPGAVVLLDDRLQPLPAVETLRAQQATKIIAIGE